MVIKVRFPQGAPVGQNLRKNAPAAGALGALTMMFAISCLMLAMWRLTSDMGWTGAFVIADGFLSHWQVWLAAALGFGYVAMRLVRYGRPHEQAPRETGAREKTPVVAEAVHSKAASR
jgi:hypothetical protein